MFVCVWMSPSPPLQSKTTASPATTSYIRLMARGAPRCWWSTLPPGGSAARSTCLWRRPSYSESTGLLLTGEHHANLWCVMNVRQGRSQDIITVVARSGQSGQPLTRGGHGPHVATPLMSGFWAMWNPSSDLVHLPMILIFFAILNCRRTQYKAWLDIPFSVE